MKAKGLLLASVAGTVVAPAVATAADMPVKAAPQPVAAPVAVAPSWAGLYIGVHAGAAWHKARADQPDAYYGTQHLNDTKPGFIGGGLIGYNLQSGIFVYGLEADISGLSAKATDKNLELDCGGSCVAAKYTLESKIDWMATLRGRIGVTTGNLLTFVTAGVAWADINNKFTYTDVCCAGGTLTWSEKKVKTAPVFGGGFEYMFSPNWLARVEGLWANFGKTAVREHHGFAPLNPGNKTTTFKNSVVIVRGALSYKF